VNKSDRPTIKDVAALAGVGIASVSRVLNDAADVSASTRERVLAAVEELGYEPDLVASGLRRGTTRTIGFIVSDIANPLFADIIKGAEESLEARDYVVLIFNSRGNPERDLTGLRLFLRRRVDGVILSVSGEDARMAEALRGVRVPVVLVDREIDGIESSAVLSDHEVGMTAAVDHLIDLGHERIALITGPLNLRPARVRSAAFRAQIEARQVVLDENLLSVGSFSSGFGESSVDRLYSLAYPPTAVIVGGVQLLSGVLRGLAKRGLQIPRDVSLVSCDDSPLAEFYSPPITVVTRDMTEMGTLAGEVMLAILNGESAPVTHRCPTRLIVRASSRALG
jgi:LacI family transcriptional regulator